MLADSEHTTFPSSSRVPEHTIFECSGQHLVSRVGVRYQNECKAYGVIRTLPIGRVAMVNNSLYEMVAALRKAIQSMGIELNMNMCFFGECYLGWEFYLFVTEMNI